MIVQYDSDFSELLAVGGSFDITGVGAVTNKQYWGFNASEGAVLAVIKGIPLKAVITTLATITAQEVDLAAFFLTALTDPLTAIGIYRVDGYIITNIQMASGSLHCYKKETQISA